MQWVIGEKKISEEQVQTAINNGLDYEIVRKRVRYRNWTVKRAISEPRKNQKTKVHPEILKLAEDNGINPNTLRNRIYNMGMNPVEAATKSTIKHKTNLKNQKFRVMGDSLEDCQKKIEEQKERAVKRGSDIKILMEPSYKNEYSHSKFIKGGESKDYHTQGWFAVLQFIN